MTPADIERALLRILPRVQKPARYIGGELNQVVKPWGGTPVRVALGFPDIYDLGMPNLGLAILYDVVNRQPDMLAERVFAPWPDMEAAMREAGVPLFSLEGKRPLADFDLIGLTLPYESIYTNVLSMLDLAGLPLLAAERGRGHPVLVGGGHATFNPEPMADVFDAFLIGEGEEAILEIARAAAAWRRGDAPRGALHRALAAIPGVYVPALYDVAYRDDGRVAAITPREGAPMPVRKRIVRRLPPPVTRFIVPNLDVVHNRAAVEIMRGCTRGCRFCQAGMITRPVRERPVEEVVDALERSLAETGFEEVGLLSLSSSDYTAVLSLVKAVAARFGDRRVNISLPSLRIESFSAELMDILQGSSRRGGFTLAPEAASERMRRIINKPVSTGGVLETARAIYGRGWHTIKLYFMIGHPSETLDDVAEIARLCRQVLAIGRQVMGGRARVHVGVSTFVPKPHTPFQWVPCDTREQVAEKQALLRRQVRGGGMKLSLTAYEDSAFEAWMSRGDRRLGRVIVGAWRRGARFDAWREHHDQGIWRAAFAAEGLDPDFYIHRQRDLDEVLPWDHIDAAVTKKFLAEDYRWSLREQTRVDCRDKCFACGILPKFKELRRETPGDAWKCPEVGRARVKAKLPAARPAVAARGPA